MDMGELETLLEIVPNHVPLYSTELLAEVEKILGCTLPPSYIEYIQRWGSGLAFGLFVIWPPDSNPHIDIRVQSPDNRHIIQEHIDWGLWNADKVEFLKGLIPFGESENSDILCWDPQKRLPNGEMPIYLLDNEQALAPYVGDSLMTFFGDYCADEKLDEVFPVGQGQKWNLPKNFDPYLETDI